MLDLLPHFFTPPIIWMRTSIYRRKNLAEQDSLKIRYVQKQSRLSATLKNSKTMTVSRITEQL